uniref:Uncharacterized protein n=1 Tax=Anguilla anguilla TaxID=7936 RepID=A0A0E9WRL2_ANGAN
MPNGRALFVVTGCSEVSDSWADSPPSFTLFLISSVFSFSPKSAILRRCSTSVRAAYCLSLRNTTGGTLPRTWCEMRRCRRRGALLSNTC